MSITAPLFKRKESLYFLRVGLCSHTVLPMQDAWQLTGRRMWSRRLRSRGPESTRSSDPPRAQKEGLSDEDRTTYLAPRGNPRTSRLASNRRAIDLHQTTAASWSKSIEIRRLTWSTSDGAEMLWKNFAIKPRSRRDRAVITARSSRDRTPSAVESTLPEPTMIDRAPGSRSTHDRGKNWKLFDREIRSKSARNWSHDPCLRNHLHDAWKPPPQTRQLPMIVGLILSLKPISFSLSNGTFDRFVKELSEFRGRSLVHCDLPAFRLNSEGIGAGLIMNSSLISSNFPLEFQKSVRKDPRKFTPIRANWSLILVEIGLVVRFDRLSRGNLSFY